MDELVSTIVPVCNKGEYLAPSKERLAYIDTLRGIGIILVILGHVYEVPSFIHDAIYGFHMPLFFVISGFLYNITYHNASPTIAYIKKRAKNYLLPYYLFAFINLGLLIVWNRFLLHKNTDFAQIIHYVNGILCCYSDMLHMPNCTPIWFLMSLFFASILFRWMLRSFRKHTWIAFVGSMLIGYTLSFLTDQRVPLKLDTVFMAVFFMFVGFWIRQKDLLKAPLWICVIGLPGLVLGSWNPVGMNENSYGNLLVFLPASLSVIYSLMLICSQGFLCRSTILRRLGKHSLLIVGFN